MDNKETYSWDRLAQRYDSLWVQKYSLGPTRCKVIECIRTAIPDTSSKINVLDVGCGTGQLLEAIAAIYAQARLTGIDNSAAMIAQASGRNIRAELVQADIASYSLGGNVSDVQADIITCCHSFPYYREKKLVIQKLHKILKTGGWAIFVQASINNIYDRIIMHFVEKTASEADYMSASGFRTIVEDYFEICDEFRIKEKIYMPSICGFVLRKTK